MPESEAFCYSVGEKYGLIIRDAPEGATLEFIAMGPAARN